MGLVDSLGAEDRVPVKYSDFERLMRGAEQLKLIKGALNSGLSGKTVLDMMEGLSPELKAYRDTGLTPEQIREIDASYTELAREKAELKAKLEELDKERAELEETVAELTKMKAEAEAEPVKPREPLNTDEIMKLRAEGWSLREIAESMDTTTGVIAEIVNDEQKRRAQEKNPV